MSICICILVKASFASFIVEKCNDIILLDFKLILSILLLIETFCIANGSIVYLISSVSSNIFILLSDDVIGLKNLL